MGVLTNVAIRKVIRESPLLVPVLDILRKRTEQEFWLGAGAVVQTVWNHRFGFEPLHGIDDLDIVWFDPDDLTEGGEAAAATDLRADLAPLPLRVDAKNQARVHLWYQGKFGYTIPAVTSMTDALERWPTMATAVALRLDSGGGIEILAPFGLEDLWGGVVRPNKRQITQEIYEAKIQKWTTSWPDLTVGPWSTESR